MIAIVCASRWRASFIARTTKACGRPADKAMTSVSESIRASLPSASCEGLATSSARKSSSIKRWRKYEAKNAIWSVPAMTIRVA